MANDTLSQNQIDSLLAQARGEEEAPTRERFHSIRPYDFRHPSKFSKEQLRTLQMIFENFARLVSANLSSALRAQVSVALVSIQQTVYDDYVRGLPATTLLNLASLDPLPGTFIYEFDLGTAFVMLERLVGGVGRPPTSEREVTDIEEVLLHTISAGFLSAITDALAHLAGVEAKLQRMEYSLRFVQIAPMSEPVVLLLFDMRILDRQTTLSMCIPYSVLEPIAQELNVQTLFAVAQKDTQLEVADSMRLHRVQVPLVALLGSTVLPLGEVNSLQVGDVVRLDGLSSDPIIVAVNKRPTFVARPGLGRQGIAVQLLGVLPEEAAS